MDWITVYHTVLVTLSVIVGVEYSWSIGIFIFVSGIVAGAIFAYLKDKE